LQAWASREVLSAVETLTIAIQSDLKNKIKRLETAVTSAKASGQKDLNRLHEVHEHEADRWRKQVADVQSEKEAACALLKEVEEANARLKEELVTVSAAAANEGVSAALQALDAELGKVFVAAGLGKCFNLRNLKCVFIYHRLF
jgi:chromosome segregation ATPase